MKIERVESEVVKVAYVIKEFCCDTMREVTEWFSNFRISKTGDLELVTSSNQFGYNGEKVSHCPFCGKPVVTVG